MNKTLIVGGDFGTAPKVSSITNKLAALFEGCETVNGGSLEDLKSAADNCSGFDLVLWIPNVSNEVEKYYPKKGRGAVLFCSKVLRKNRNEADAIARIFKMNGNAVIAISRTDNLFSFKLIDALGNKWADSSELSEIADKIKELTSWTQASVRTASTQSDFDFPDAPAELEKLISLNSIVADNFEAIGSRYFGNVSTRCMKMFPTMRLDSVYIIVSKRNVDKKRLTAQDFVKVRYQDKIEYIGEAKPSVDTPIQLNIYRNFLRINYIIHGHGYIEGYAFTEHYYPCGDLREYEEFSRFLKDNSGIINLINHGFVIYANHIDDMEQLIEGMKFMERPIGNEIPHL